jgi:hypothetical protein
MKIFPVTLSGAPPLFIAPDRISSVRVSRQGLNQKELNQITKQGKIIHPVRNVPKRLLL